MGGQPQARAVGRLPPASRLSMTYTRGVDVPGPLALLLLTLGGFRLVRLVGWDTITEPLRIRLTSFRDDGAPSLSDADYDEHGTPVGHGTARLYLSTLVRCPWCQGFWLAWLLYGAWLIAPDVIVPIMVPLSLSSAFGLIAKNLDP